MEPLPETLEAIARLSRSGDTEVAAELARLAREVRAVVPQVVGLSISLPVDNFTFTLVADSDLARDIDVVQYVDDGPCLGALWSEDVVSTEVEDLFHEGRWQMFAQAAAARGVRSSLSLPVVRGGSVVACVNLYAGSENAFEGHHEQLAAICGADAPTAVTNADLAFSSRLEATATPRRMAEQDAVDQAVGMLAQFRHLRTEDAAQRIRRAAERAGISEAQAARAIIGVLSAS